MIFGSAAFGFSFVTPRLYPALLYDALVSFENKTPSGTTDRYLISLTYFHQAYGMFVDLQDIYEGWIDAGIT